MYERIIECEKANSIVEAAIDVMKKHYPDKKCSALLVQSVGSLPYCLKMCIGKPFIEKTLQSEIRFSGEFYDEDQPAIIEFVRHEVEKGLSSGDKLT